MTWPVAYPQSRAHSTMARCVCMCTTYDQLCCRQDWHDLLCTCVAWLPASCWGPSRVICCAADSPVPHAFSHAHGLFMLIAAKRPPAVLPHCDFKLQAKRAAAAQVSEPALKGHSERFEAAMEGDLRAYCAAKAAEEAGGEADYWAFIEARPFAVFVITSAVPCVEPGAALLRLPWRGQPLGLHPGVFFLLALISSPSDCVLGVWSGLLRGPASTCVILLSLPVVLGVPSCG